MNGGNIIVDIALRGAQKFSSDMKRAQADVQTFEKSSVFTGAGLARGAVTLGAVAVGANVLGRNLKQLGDTGSVFSRGGGFLSAFTSGDLAGAIGAARETVKFTEAEIKQLGTTSTKSAAEVEEVARALELTGANGAMAAGELRKVRAEINAINALNYALATPGSQTHPDNAGGMRGYGAIQQSNAGVVTNRGPGFRAGVGMSTSLQTAIMAARTSPGKSDEIAQLRRAEKELMRQRDSGALKTDEARLTVYTQLEAVQDELTMLTKKTVEKEKKRAKAKRAEVAALSFTEIDAASQVGGLGGGPFMGSDTFSFARSFGYQPKARDFLRDIRAQNAQALGFERNLGKLGRRGLSDAAIGEFRGMGMGAAEQVAAFAGSGNKSDIAALNKAVATREGVAERLQVADLRANINRASVVIQNANVVGVDRNGDGKLSKNERFAMESGARGR